MRKRILALLLCFLMLAAYLPTGIAATDPAEYASPGLNFRTVVQDANGNWIVSPYTGYYQNWPASPKQSITVQFVYLSGAYNVNQDVVSPTLLNIPSQLNPVYNLTNRDGTPADSSFVQLSFMSIGDYTIEYPNAPYNSMPYNNMLHINVAYPSFGFYTSSTMTPEGFVSNGWDFDGTQDTLYLICSWTDTEIYSVSPDTVAANIERINERCYKIKLLNYAPQYQSDYLIFRCANSYYGSDYSTGVVVNDVRPQLLWRMCKWDPNTQSYVSDPSQQLNSGNFEGSPRGRAVVEFFYDDHSGDPAAIPYSALRFEGSGYTVTSQGNLAVIQFTDFGSVKVSYQGASRTIPITLPVYGFYSALQATEGNYLKQWNYNGTNNEIYLMSNPNFHRDFSDVASVEDVNSTGFTWEIDPNNPYYIKFTITDPKNDSLSCKLLNAAGNQITWQSIRINDARPGLYYGFPDWQNGEPVATVNPSELYKYTLTTSPNAKRPYEFFWRAQDGTLTRLKASDLTVTGNAFTLLDEGSFVGFLGKSFGEGTITYQNSSIPVRVTLPANGFYSAPRMSEETYIQSFSNYNGEAQTLYYTTTTPGDLVIDTVNSTNSNITATVENGGKFIRIEPAQGAYGNFGGQITYSGTDPHYTNAVTGQLYVNFHIPQPQLYCIPVLAPADETTYDGMYSGMGRPVGTTVTIRPYIRVNGQMRVYTGSLTPLDSNIVQLILQDADAHYWQVSFLSDGQTWLKGTENGTDYYIGIHPSNPNTSLGEYMYFELVNPPHSDYQLTERKFTGFGINRGDSLLFRFVDEGGNPVTSGLTYDNSAITVEEVPNTGFTGVYKITGNRIGDHTITANGRICDVFVNGWSHQFTEVPAASPDCTTDGTLLHWVDEDGQLYLLPEYPYAASEVMTRAKLAQLFCTACGWLETGLNNPYSDVDPSMPEYDAILTLTKYGIVVGTGNGEYKPNNPVTRAEAARLMMVCTLWGSTMQPQSDPAPDVPVGHWAATSVQFCLENGFLKTDSNGNFNPQNQLLFEEIGLVDLMRWTWNRQVTQAAVVDPATGHTLTHVAAVAATNTSEGSKEYWQCSVCGKIFSDAEGKTEVTLADVTIPKLQPTPAQEIIPSAPAQSTTTETTTNEDGSTTTTVTDADGTVTETVTETDGKVTETVTEADGSTKETVTNTDGSTEVTSTAADGSTAAVKTDAEGKVTEASAELTAEAIEAAEDQPITLNLELSADKESEEAPQLAITIPEEAGPVKVEIPVKDVSSSSIVVLVHEDGTEEILPKAALSEDGLVIEAAGSVTVKILDNEKEFDDVSEEHWGSEAIDFVTSRELFLGTEENTFAPDLTMTRAMAVTVLFRLESKPETEGTSAFADVPEGQWYSDAVNWASENEIIQGYGDSFGKDDPITREQLVVMLYRLAGKPEAEAVETGASDWAADAMSWAVSIGLIEGNGDGYNAQSPATRVETAALLMRFVNR